MKIIDIKIFFNQAFIKSDDDFRNYLFCRMIKPQQSNVVKYFIDMNNQSYHIGKIYSLQIND